MNSLNRQNYSNPLLAVLNLEKSFGSERAVAGVSFEVHQGKCFGLLGPNGAGKTTLMEMIEMVKKPDQGQILFQNQPINQNFLNQLGVQFQETALPVHLTVRETLEIFSALYPSSMEINQLIELCQIKSFEKKRHNQISGGQRQRLMLAIALCNNPELILLDEPTTGLDPQARRHLWSIVKDIKSQGKTLILTTHYMEEAYELCDQIGIIDHGKMIAQGKPSKLLKESFFEVVLEIPKNAISDLSLLKPYTHTIFEHHYQILTEDLNQTLKELINHGIDLSHLSTRQSSLEDLFLKLTGNKIRN